MKDRFCEIQALPTPARIPGLRAETLVRTRYVSFEQAAIVTESYRRNEGLSIARKRAESFRDACCRIEIAIGGGELIVGNRTRRPRDGVVFPEGGIGWVEREIDRLPVRQQDPFQVRPEDRDLFFRDILPYWREKTLEDRVQSEVGGTIARIGAVVNINQTDHAQGHICPDSAAWLRKGPAGLKREAEAAMAACAPERREFYACVAICMDGAVRFLRRYGDLAAEQAEDAAPGRREELLQIAENCRSLAMRPARGYWEALQSAWFLFVLLQLESNASSFSPGRYDQILLPYFRESLDNGDLSLDRALELTECLFLKFNQVVYLRSEKGARYFAGFPIGFNLAVGGQLADGSDAVNDLSYLLLRAQRDVHLPQPNLSARLHRGTPLRFLREVTKLIGTGGGMPQLFNDEIVVPALERQGVAHADAMDYAIVGCVELTTQGNNLGWSDAAMFNMVKALELATNDGKCLLTGRQMGPRTGNLEEFASYASFERAFQAQIDYFIEAMMPVTRTVDRLHGELLPSAFLSGVVQDCLTKGVDVTQGGAKYNFSGIQLIQVANIADSLAALKQLVFTDRSVDAAELHRALLTNFQGREALRGKLLNGAPKYGNDDDGADLLAVRWQQYFADRLEAFQNARGGRVQCGMYTVSAHVPMGLNVGATPDGRLAGTPLADGGVSAVYGRDRNGPTALLNSVAKLNMLQGSNGSLLNLKFLPEFFAADEGVDTFCALLRTIVELGILHCQINVVSRADLLAARERPEEYQSLTIRVAGYTAFFVELADDLQNEIIARTAFGGGA